jgi:glycosyltransferase involved in cell wall biosynthesis
MGFGTLDESRGIAIDRAPRTLHIVLNSVVEDSRVLKCAWSLGNAGWDVLVIGASATPEIDEIQIGYARIKRLHLKPVITQQQMAILLRLMRKIKRKIENRIIKKLNPPIPNLLRSVNAITPVAMEFLPDVIHAHDYTALPIAGAILKKLRESGHKCELIYDAHEYVPGVAHLNKPLRRVYTKKERQYTSESAAVLSVSAGMNELLMPHLAISYAPEIIANDPLVEGQQPSKRNLRKDCGIDDGVPLLVYSGAVAPQRGVGDALEALRKMPDVHLALIANPKNATVIKYVEEFADLKDRFHVLPYVPNAELVSYLSGADIGLIPIHHKLNHEISLITKFGEYMQARLPIVVSDVRTMSAEVRRLGNGEVFIAQDVADFARAVEKVIANKQKYASVYNAEILNERSWERQAENLVAIYNRVAKATPERRLHKDFIIQK